MNSPSANFGTLPGEQPEWNMHSTDGDTSRPTLDTVFNDHSEQYANFYGNHNVYVDEGTVHTLNYTDQNQYASTSCAMDQFMDFHAPEQMVTSIPQQHYAHSTRPLQSATGFTGLDFAQQPVDIHQFGMDNLDVHHVCRQTEGRDRATIAQLEYNVQNLHNFIRLREEEHDLAIQALNEQIDRISLGKRQQMCNDRLLTPQPSAPPVPPPAVIDLDDLDNFDETDTSDSPPSGKQVKRSHSSMRWLTPPASDALKRATGWLANPQTTVERRRAVSATPATSVETEDDAETDFLTHWNAAEEADNDTVEEA